MLTFKLPGNPNSLPLVYYNLGVPRLFPLMNKFQLQHQLILFFVWGDRQVPEFRLSLLHCDFLLSRGDFHLIVFPSNEFRDRYTTAVIICLVSTKQFGAFAHYFPFRTLHNVHFYFSFKCARPGFIPRLYRPDAGSSCLIKLAVEIIHKFSQKKKQDGSSKKKK
jgi:hypothetical protein